MWYWKHEIAGLGAPSGLPLHFLQRLGLWSVTNCVENIWAALYWGSKLMLRMSERLSDFQGGIAKCWPLMFKFATKLISSGILYLGPRRVSSPAATFASSLIRPPLWQPRIHSHLRQQAYASDNLLLHLSMWDWLLRLSLELAALSSSYSTWLLGHKRGSSKISLSDVFTAPLLFCSLNFKYSHLQPPPRSCSTLLCNNSPCASFPRLTAMSNQLQWQATTSKSTWSKSRRIPLRWPLSPTSSWLTFSKSYLKQISAS